MAKLQKETAQSAAVKLLPPTVATHFTDRSFRLKMSSDSNSMSRSDPHEIGSPSTEDFVGYENRGRIREQMINSQRTGVSGVSTADAVNDEDREYRRLMRENPDIANQNDMRSLKMEYVGLRNSAKSMADASKNDGRGMAQNLEEKPETTD